MDRAALAAYCQAYADWVEAEEQLRRYGKVVKSPIKTTTRRSKGDEVTETTGGFPMQSPFLPIRNRALETMHRFLSEFGMTPASRSRINVPNGSMAKDPADKYFSAG
jgi:P27 family predicted phage terminase small subunit